MLVAPGLGYVPNECAILAWAQLWNSRKVEKVVSLAKRGG